MATTAAQRQSIAEKIMRLGTGVVAIANPRGPDVDAILVKEPDYTDISRSTHDLVPAATRDPNGWLARRLAQILQAL